MIAIKRANQYTNIVYEYPILMYYSVLCSQFYNEVPPNKFRCADLTITSYSHTYAHTKAYQASHITLEFYLRFLEDELYLHSL